MKTFLPMFAASALAVVVALLTYDILVAQPREARMQAAQQAALDAAADAGLAGAREQAAQVASELDASVNRTVANARDAMASEASAVDMRGRIVEGLNRASMVKLAVAESYMNYGRWPLDATEAGLGTPESYAVGAVTAIALGTEGVITIRYNDLVAPGAQIRLIPRAQPDIGSIDWRCEAEAITDQNLLPIACR